jgi:hypothetical protein
VSGPPETPSRQRSLEHRAKLEEQGWLRYYAAAWVSVLALILFVALFTIWAMGS